MDYYLFTFFIRHKRVALYLGDRPILVVVLPDFFIKINKDENWKQLRY